LVIGDVEEHMTAKDAIEDIRELVSDGGGYFDPATASRYRSALASIRIQSSMHCNEKIFEAQQWLDIYYSPRKTPEVWRRLQQIRVWILSALSVVEGRLKN